MEIQAIDLTRDMLREFIPNPRTIRAFENLNLNQTVSTDILTEIQNAPVIGTTTSDVFTSDRFLNGSSDILVTDGGAKGPVTVSLAPSGVSAGTYGSATQLVGLAIDNKGRITLAAQYALNSDNVTEGAANLFFTNARARTALSNGTGMAYNNATGVIAVGATLAAYAGGDAPSPFTLSIVDSADAAAWRTAIGAGTSTVTPSALTKADDTNVTLTLGGSPSTALLAATSLTLGWTGTLAVARGGTGTSTSTGSGSVVLSTSPTLVAPIVSAAPSTAWGLDFAPSTSAPNYVTIANNGTYDLAVGSGMVLIWDDAGVAGAGQFACWFGNTAIVWQAAAAFSVTSGTAGKVNFFYNAGTGKYRIQNLSGSTVNLFIGSIRMRTSS